MKSDAVRWPLTLTDFLPIALLSATLFLATLSCRKAVHEPQFYRFDDNLDKATRVTAPEVQETVTGFSFEFDNPGEPVWKAGKSTSMCEIKDGLLIFETQEADSLVSPERSRIAARDLESILIRMKIIGADVVRFYWTRQQGQFSEAAGLTVKMPETNRWCTLEIKASGPIQWEGAIEQLMLKVPGNVRLEVDSIRVLAKEAYFSQNPVGVVRHRMGAGIRPGDSYRSCLYAHCPAEIEYRVRVPENAHLSTGLGTIYSTPPVTLSVLVRRGGVVKQLVSRELVASSEWHDTRIDMTEYAGEEVGVIFRAGSKEGGNIVLLSNPILYRAKSSGEVSSSQSRLQQRQDVNVVLYLIDALRADHLDVYGYPRETAPTITRLAEEGVRFARCFAHDTWTKPSLSCLFTGTTAWLHGPAEEGEALPDSVITVAEILRARGYATAAFSRSVYAGPHTNLDQGFGEFELPNVDEATFESARRFLEMHRDRDFFVYIHTIEPHTPYEPPEGFLSKFAIPIQALAPIDRYDGEVARADADLGRLVSVLKDLRLYDNTALIVLADHGEAFGEHEGITEHCGKPYNELIHIPLIMYLPGLQPKVNVVEQNVGLMDVGPTMLDIVGIPAPDHFEGASLLPLVGGEVADVFDERSICSRGRWEGVSVIRGNWKLLADSGKPKLFNLDVDFGEEKNLADTNEPLVARLLEDAQAYIASQEKIAGATKTSEEESVATFDQRTIEQLKALGYLK